VRHRRDHRALDAGGERIADHTGAPQRRLANADRLAKERQHLDRVPELDLVDLRPERDLVAEQLAAMGVGGAAAHSQKRDIIDLG
jgi:hypothetical protein